MKTNIAVSISYLCRKLRSVTLIATGAVLACGALAQSPLPVLSEFRFEGDGTDDTGNSPPMLLLEVSVTNGVLVLPCTSGYNATARINGFSYDSFAVSFDFKPASLDPLNSTLLCGGPAYRWLGLEVYQGRLHIALNNWNRVYSFTNTVSVGQWHTLLCSVDLAAQQIRTVLDGTRLADIQLQHFNFEVVGTSFEDSDKTFSFWNPGDASRFCGTADNLRVYSRALSPAELDNFSGVRLTIQRSDQIVVVSWPGDPPGWALQYQDVDAIRGPWFDSELPPLVIGNQRVSFELMGTHGRLYRLTRR